MGEKQIADDTYVRKFGFRRFTGIRQTRIFRIMAVAWFNLLETIRRSGFTKFLLFIMIINILLQDIISILIYTLIPLSFFNLTLDQAFRFLYIDSLLGSICLINRVSSPELDFSSIVSISSVGTSVMWLLLISIVGGGLIADDRLYRITEVYFSRISRYEYILGKLLSLIIFSSLIVTFPAVLQYFLLAGGLRVSSFAHLDLLFWGIGFTLISALLLSLLILALSSFTKRRSVATLTLFIAAIVMSVFYSVLAGSYQSQSYLLLLDFIGCIALCGALLLGFEEVLVNGWTVNFYDGVGVEGYMVLEVVILVFLLGILAIIITILRRDS
jgi:ABC-type transport system involved in multi-copper enzyme maturation permease subunit